MSFISAVKRILITAIFEFNSWRRCGIPALFKHIHVHGADWNAFDGSITRSCLQCGLPGTAIELLTVGAPLSPRLFLLDTTQAERAADGDASARPSGGDTRAIACKIGVKDGATVLSLPLVTDSSAVRKCVGLGLKFAPLLKNGRLFDNYNQDVFYHTRHTDALYSTANIMYLVGDRDTILLIVDYPGKIRWDAGKTDPNLLAISFVGKQFQVLAGRFPTFRDAARYLYRLIAPEYVPPEWAFGYVQSRWGVRDLSDVEEIAATFAEKKIPLSAICVDIEYMDGFRDFTTDPKLFGDFKARAGALKKKGVHLIPILDAGVKKDDDYWAAQRLLRENIAVKKGDGSPFVGSVWPGPSYFPDFVNPRGETFWREEVGNFLDATGAEGIWNDMNEPSVFSTVTRNFTPDCVFSPADVDGTANGESVPDASAHNIYPYFQNKATYDAFTERNIRPLLISRSGYTGQGKWAGNWTGDNFSRFSHLKTGFYEVMNLSLCGIPFSGTDIGGFFGFPTERLVEAWHHAALVHPFYRNHSSKLSERREPYKLKNCDRITALARFRHEIRPLIYSAYLAAHFSREPYLKPVGYYGDSPLAWEGNACLLDADILFVPHFSLGKKTSFRVMFPEGTWASWPDGARMNSPKGGGYLTVESDLEKPRIWIREGAIVPVSAEWSQAPGAAAIRFIAARRTAAVPVGYAGSLFHDFGIGKGIGGWQLKAGGVDVPRLSLETAHLCGFSGNVPIEKTEVELF